MSDLSKAMDRFTAALYGITVVWGGWYIFKIGLDMYETFAVK